MVLNLKIQFAILSGFAVLVSLQQRFPHDYQTSFMSPWSYLDGFSDTDLYSYLLARRFALPNRQRLAASHHPNRAASGFAPPGFSRISQYPLDGERVIVHELTQDKNEEESTEVQSRSKNDGIQPDNPRFLFNFVTTIGSTNTYYNPLLKTIYYFTTATTTITSTTTCITSTAFTSSSFTVICRKRRDLLEILFSIDDEVDEGPEKAASISPSRVQEVLPTVVLAASQAQLISSKDEDGLSNERPTLRQTDAAQLRMKRFFVSTTIVTTYMFSTVTTTRTLSTNLVGAASLSCRPSQFTYC